MTTIYLLWCHSDVVLGKGSTGKSASRATTNMNNTLCFVLSEIKVDCLTVSTAPVKATIDDHIQTLMDTLLLTLRRSAMSDINTIDKFITDGMDTLTPRPQTVSTCTQTGSMYPYLPTNRYVNKT